MRCIFQQNSRNLFEVERSNNPFKKPDHHTGKALDYLFLVMSFRESLLAEGPFI